MKNLILCIMFVIAVCVNYSCATIFSGTKTRVQVSGEQEDALVYYNGSYKDKAPCSFKVSKKGLKDGTTIQIKKEGYEDAEVKLIRKTKVGSIVGNIFFNVGLGIVIDAITGAMYKPFPRKIKYNLIEKK